MVLLGQSGIPTADQLVFYSGRQLTELKETLEVGPSFPNAVSRTDASFAQSYGVKQDDMLLVRQKSQVPQATPSVAGRCVFLVASARIRKLTLRTGTSKRSQRRCVARSSGTHSSWHNCVPFVFLLYQARPQSKRISITESARTRRGGRVEPDPVPRAADPVQRDAKLGQAPAATRGRAAQLGPVQH